VVDWLLKRALTIREYGEYLKKEALEMKLIFWKMKHTSY
jgi:hypothetical protein